MQVCQTGCHVGIPNWVPELAKPRCILEGGLDVGAGGAKVRHCGRTGRWSRCSQGAASCRRTGHRSGWSQGAPLRVDWALEQAEPRCSLPWEKWAPKRAELRCSTTSGLGAEAGGAEVQPCGRTGCWNKWSRGVASRERTWHWSRRSRGATSCGLARCRSWWS